MLDNIGKVLKPPFNFVNTNDHHCIINPLHA